MQPKPGLVSDASLDGQAAKGLRMHKELQNSHGSYCNARGHCVVVVASTFQQGG